MIKKYLKVWWVMSRNSFVGSVYSRLSFLLFFIGKMVRIGVFTAFLIFLLKEAGGLVGYTLEQAIFIFLTFNMIDIIGQFLYREVYQFKPLIISGDFDLVLAKPASSLFRGLMGGADLIDLVTIPILLIFVYLVGMELNPGLNEMLIYVFLLVNGLVITTAFHITILGLYVRFLELDYVLWLYRDILNLGKLPVGVYKEPLRSVLIYLVPVATMVTVPARAMMGLVSLRGVLISLVIGVVGIYISMRFWRYALRYYTSASS